MVTQYDGTFCIVVRRGEARVMQEPVAFILTKNFRQIFVPNIISLHNEMYFVMVLCHLVCV